MKKVTLALLAVATLTSTAVSAHQAGDYIFRAGTATVRPNAGSDDVLGYGSFKADNNTQLGLTFSYLITDNIGVELLAATPFRHKIGLGPTGDIAEVKQLPPTLMAQYYFRDKQDKLRPYLGIGLNYTTFFDEKFNNTGSSAGLTDLNVKDSWGVAGQAGLDYMVSENWMLNMSVWWMNIETDVKFKAVVKSRVFILVLIRGCLCLARVIVSNLPVVLAATGVLAAFTYPNHLLE